MTTSEDPDRAALARCYLRFARRGRELLTKREHGGMLGGDTGNDKRSTQHDQGSAMNTPEFALPGAGGGKITE